MKKLFIWSLALILLGGTSIAMSTVIAVGGIEEDVKSDDESVAVHSFFKKNFKSVDHEKVKWNGEDLKIADDVHIKITGVSNGGKSHSKSGRHFISISGVGDEDSIKYDSPQARNLKIESINPVIQFQLSETTGAEIKIKMSEKAKKLWKDSYIKSSGTKVEIETKEFEDNCEDEKIDSNLSIVIFTSKNFDEIAIGLVNGEINGTVSSEKFLVVGVNAELDLKVATKETSINLVNGEIVLDSDTPSLEIKSVNSEVKVTNLNSAGKANIQTVNGEILLVSEEPMKAVDFRSVSGELKLKVKQPFEISGDFKEVKGKSSSKQGEVLKITGSCTFCELDVVSR